MQNAGQVKYVITADVEEFLSKLMEAQKNVSSFAKSTNSEFNNASKNASNANKEISASLGNVSQAALSVGQNFRKMSSDAVAAFAPIKDAANATTTVIAGLGGALGGTLANYAQQGIQGADFLQKSYAQIIGLMHSTDGAKDAIAQATKFFKNNPFQRFETIAATKSLLSFGTAGKDVYKTLDLVGNVSLTTGASIEELANLYGKATAQNRVGLADVQEMALRAPGIWAALGKVMGVSTGQVQEKLNRVGIETEKFKQAFKSLYDEAARGEFEKTMSRQLDRVKGRMANVAAALGGYTIDVKNGFVGVSGGLYSELTKMYKVFADTMTETSDGSVTTGNRIRDALTKISMSLGSFTGMLTAKLPKILDKVATYIEKIATGFENFTAKVKAGGFSVKSLIPVFAVLGSNILGFVSNITGGAGGLLGAVGSSAEGLRQLNPLVFILAAAMGKGLASSGPFRDSVNKLMTALGKLSVAFAKAGANIVNSEGFEKTLINVTDTLAKVADVIADLPTPVLEAFIYALMAKQAIGPIKDFGTSIFNTGKSIIDFGKTVATETPKIVKYLSNLGKATAAESIAKSPAADLGTTGMSEALTQQAQPLTKMQSAMKTFRMAFQNLIWAAAAVLAIGFALRGVHELLNFNLLELVPKIGAIVAVSGVMALLGKAVEKVKLTASSFKPLIAAAGTLALTALAMKAVDTLIPNDMSYLSLKLLAVAGVLVTMGVIAGLAGLAKDKIQAGIFPLISSLGVMVLAAGAIKLVDLALPADLTMLLGKLAVLGGVLIVFGALSALAGQFSSQILSGFLPLVSVSGVIIAGALALAAVNYFIPNDLGTLILKAATLGGVLIAFGVLAGIASGFLPAILTGSISLIAISGTMAIGALAIKAMDVLIPSDFGALMSKLGSMVLVLTAIGVLAAAAALALPLIMPGLAGLIMISGTMLLVSTAIATMDKVIPKNVEGLVGKVENMGKVIVKLGEMSLGNMFGNIGKSIEMQPVLAMIDNYIKLGEAFVRLQSIPINPVAALIKLNMLKMVVNTVKEKTVDLGAVVETLVATMAQSAVTSKVLGVVEQYNKLALELMKLQMIPLMPELFMGKLTILKTAVDHVRANASDLGGLLAGLVLGDVQTNVVQKVIDVTSLYYKLSEEFAKISTLNITEEGINHIIDQSNLISKGMHAIRNGARMGGLFDDVATFFGGEIKPDIVNKVAEASGYLKKIGENLLSLKDMALTDEVIGTITNKIDIISSGIRKVRDTFKTGGFFEGVGNFFGGSSDPTGVLNSFNSQLGTLKDIATKLQGIKDIPLDEGAIKTKIDQVTSIMSHIKTKFESGFIAADKMSNMKLSIGHVSDIIGILINIAGKIQAFVAPDTSILASFITNINNLMNNGATALATGATNLKNKLSTAITDLNAVPNSLDVNVLSNKLNEALNNANNKAQEFKKIGETIKNSVNESMSNSNFSTLGRNVGEGLIEGIRAIMPRVAAQASALAGTIEKQVRFTLDIHSPSRVMKSLGVYTGEGLNLGLASQVGNISKTVSNLTSSIVNPIEATSSVNLNGSAEAGSTSGTSSQTINVYYNGTNDIDGRQIGRDILWEMRTA